MKSLFEQWHHWHDEEVMAAQHRIAIEAEIGKIIDSKDEGQTTVRVDEWKCTVKRSISRKLNEADWEKIRDQIPEELRPVYYEEKLALDMGKFRELQKTPYFLKFSECLTEKPNKPNYQIERI
jgi:hypothetical protein